MDDYIVLVVLLIVFIGGYFFLMYFYPEWVGISGKKTHEIQADHVEKSKDLSK